MRLTTLLLVPRNNESEKMSDINRIINELVSKAEAGDPTAISDLDVKVRAGTLPANLHQLAKRVVDDARRAEAA